MVQAGPIPRPDAHEVLVRAEVSAISAGSELLVYRGEFPEGEKIDASIPALAGDFEYPFSYGYALVGRVVSRGREVDSAWDDRLVFAFHPHVSHFLASPESLIPVPEGVAPDAAVFLPNMETAAGLVMDGRPLIGETVAVLGQGVVGLLTTALLAAFPLESLVTADRWQDRREASLAIGAQASLDPDADDYLARMRSFGRGAGPGRGLDLVFELSGSLRALNEAIAVVGYNGRVIVGSWYGGKPASLDLGSRFHRNRIRVLSSQVSTLAPGLRGRWTKERRLFLAWREIKRVRPDRWITHRFSIEQAQDAYRFLDRHDGEGLQVVFVY